MRKKLLFYGNCHASSIARWVHENYFEQFELLDCSECKVTEHLSTKNFAVWKDDLETQKQYYKCVHNKIAEADFFIFQPIEQAAIEELQTDYLINNVVKGKAICIPNTRFYSYPICEISLMPQVKYIYQNITKKKEEILKYLTNENDPKFKEIVFSTYEHCMTENKKRYYLQTANVTDKIDMCEFIENNWTKHLLFGTHNHPIGVYWRELVAKLFIYFKEEIDLNKFKRFTYPNKNQILNVTEFCYFREAFPNIIIPDDIKKIVSIKDAGTDLFPHTTVLKEPLTEYYA